MAIKASEADPGKVYRLTRGAGQGTYYKVYGPGRDHLIRRMERRRNGLNGQQAGLLAQLLRHPDWLVFVWHYRGTDPFTGARFEITRKHALPPDQRLREVKSKPGY